MALIDPLSQAISKITTLPIPTTPIQTPVTGAPQPVLPSQVVSPAPSQNTQQPIITIPGWTPVTTIPRPETPNVSPTIEGFTPQNLPKLGYSVGLSGQSTPQQVSSVRSAISNIDIRKMALYSVFERMNAATEWTLSEIKSLSGFVEAPKIAKPVIGPLQAVGTGFIEGVASIPSWVTSSALGAEIIAREPKAAVAAIPIGLGLMAGGMTKQITENTLGTIGSFVGQGMALGGIGKGITKVSEIIKFSGKEYIPSSKIIEPQVLSRQELFPVTPKGGLTPEQLITEFKTSKYKLPGTESKLGGWHATPQEFGVKTTEVQIGTSSVPGLHIAPSLSKYFLNIPKEISTKLFGWDTPPPSKPAALWLEVQKISRTPEEFRGTKAVSYLIKDAPKGEAFITPKFEKLVKLHKVEKEAVITPASRIIQTGNKYYTVIEGKKVPIQEWRAPPESITEKGLGSKDITTAGELFNRQSLSYESYRSYQKALITPKSLAKIGYGVASLSRTKLGKEYKQPYYKPKFKLYTPEQYTPKVKDLSFIQKAEYFQSSKTVDKIIPHPVEFKLDTSNEKASFVDSITGYPTPTPTIRTTPTLYTNPGYTPTPTPKIPTPYTPEYTPPKYTPEYTPTPKIPTPTPIITKIPQPSIFKKKRKGKRSFFKFGEGAKIATIQEMFKRRR